MAKKKWARGKKGIIPQRAAMGEGQAAKAASFPHLEKGARLTRCAAQCRDRCVPPPPQHEAGGDIRLLPLPLPPAHSSKTYGWALVSGTDARDLVSFVSSGGLVMLTPQTLNWPSLAHPLLLPTPRCPLYHSNSAPLAGRFSPPI
jgi:hypothetical protein